MTKALLLAGGKGTRLGKLTENTPKPLIKVADKPIIEHLVNNLNLYGIYDIIIHTSYLATQINEKLETRALYYHMNKSLGHKGTIFALKSWLKGEPFFVINADTLTNINYTDMMNFHKLGTVTCFMDAEYRAGGTWIYDDTLFVNSVLDIRPYRPHSYFYDTGTPEKLELARLAYE
jgi:Nucleoside-diphosphate-sugar pyrophosphorylase involved in lipopolysaccharide biosynthesis/translation initiation factor 2B, gamma/epsilon subunits (eIF-2Bgamma/eIF-2Bepsilon)